MEPERQFDRFARGARRGNDDDPPLGMGRVAVGVGIGREMVVAGRVHEGMKDRRSAIANRQKPCCRFTSHTQFLSGRSNGWTALNSRTAKPNRLKRNPAPAL